MDLSLDRQAMGLFDLFHQDSAVRDQMCFSEIIGGFVNLTERVVPKTVRVLFSFGPAFVPPHLPTFSDTISVLSHLYTKFEKTYPHMDPVHQLNQLLFDYGDELSKFCAGANNVGHEAQVLLSMLQDAKVFLQTNPDLCLVQADKGKITVLMSQADYRLKMDKWVDICISKGVYVLYTGNILSKIRVIRSAYHRLRRQFISLYDSQPGQGLYPYKFYIELNSFMTLSPVPPYLYGTAKVHKPDCPIRPICGTRSFFTHPIQGLVSYFLGGVLRPYLSNHNVYDVGQVVSQLYLIPVCKGYVFVKYDIVDMYTSMDRHRIFQYLSSLCEDPLFRNRLPIPPRLFLSAVHFSFNIANILTYGSKIYEQRCGLPQGACDSGLLATVYLDSLLALYQNSMFTVHKTVYWWKYMDDFLLYIPEDLIDSFLEVFEKLVGLQLTKELEVDKYGGSFISFLDIGIVRKDGRIHTFMYTKSIASLRMLHYHSNMCPQYRKATVLSFINKILNRTSTIFLLEDVKSLEVKVFNNGYPYLFISKLFVSALLKAITALQAHDFPFYMSSTEVSMRLNILSELVYRYPHSDSIVPSYGKVTSMVHRPIQRLGKFVSTTYYCEDLCRYIKRLSDRYNMVPTVYRKGKTLFQHLNMSLSDKLYYDGNKSHINTGISFCGDCSYAFIFSGVDNIDSLYDSIQHVSDSAVSIHIANTGHRILPVVHQLNGIGDLDLSTRLALYKALYSILGVSVESNLAIGVLPQYFRRYVSIIYRQYSKNGKNFILRGRNAILPLISPPSLITTRESDQVINLIETNDNSESSCDVQSTPNISNSSVLCVPSSDATSSDFQLNESCISSPEEDVGVGVPFPVPPEEDVGVDIANAAGL